MRHRILFIVNDLETGGVTKSLTSLLSVIDKEKYDLSLLALTSEGPLRKLVPEEVRVISSPVFEALTHPFKGLPYLVKKKPLLALGHCARLALSAVSKDKAARLIARLLPGIEEEFDTIVDYGGQFQLYYMIDRLKAKRKLTFFHSDYSKYPYYFKSDCKYFPLADHIFTVSEHCVKVLKQWFPEVANKISLMENISSLDVICRLAEGEINDMETTEPSILTVGHVTEMKGAGLALKAAKILKDRGVAFHWYFLGKNDNAEHYRQIVEEYGLADRITYLGIRTNPYPYMRKAAIIAHPAKFEGKSIALDEIKLLMKPSVVTNFSTVHDQFEDGYNATICEMTPESLADAISELLRNEELRAKYSANLLKDRKDNSDEIEKLYKEL